MLFPDYSETGVVYHVAPITDLEKILKNGVKYDDKTTYLSKYFEFHSFIDSFKPKDYPQWVKRKEAVFASINFSDNHLWHSHSVLMALKIKHKRCWVANENLANTIYEPFILRKLDMFRCANHYIEKKGIHCLIKYWQTSLSFEDNLNLRLDLTPNYDGEVLIFHNIPPEDIQLLAIVSDHRMMTIENWKKLFLCGGWSSESR